MGEFKSPSNESSDPILSKAESAAEEQPIIQSVEDVNVTKKPRRKWLIFLIIFIILILVPSGLVTATELGYLKIGLDKYYNSIGLEKLWGGLPVSPEKALPEVAKKMSDANSFHIEGLLNLDGEISSDIPQVSKILEQRQKQVLGNQSESVSVQVGIAGDYQKPEELKATLSVELSDELSDLLGSLGLGNSFNIDIINLDNKVYLKIPSLGLLTGSNNNKWYKMDLGMYNTPNQKTFDELIMQQVNDSLSGQPVKSYQRKLSKVDGKSVYEYRIIIDKEKLKAKYPDVGNFSSDPVFSFDIGVKNHLLYQVNFEGDFRIEGFESSVKLNLDLSDFNKSFQIDAPEENEVSEESLFQALEPLLFGSGLGSDNINANDARRKSDLASIEAALEMYYDENNNQYPVSNGTVKISDENSSIYQALIPFYLPEMPKDPKDPEFYYGYQSDGNSYQLSCVLEDKSDPEGQQVGNLYLYIRKSE